MEESAGPLSTLWLEQINYFFFSLIQTESTVQQEKFNYKNCPKMSSLLEDELYLHTNYITINK